MEAASPVQEMADSTGPPKARPRAFLAPWGASVQPRAAGWVGAGEPGRSLLPPPLSFCKGLWGTDLWQTLSQVLGRQ